MALCPLTRICACVFVCPQHEALVFASFCRVPAQRVRLWHLPWGVERGAGVGRGLGRVVSTASPGCWGALHAGAAHPVVLCLRTTVPVGCEHSEFLVLDRHLDRCVLYMPRPAATTTSAAALGQPLSVACLPHVYPLSLSQAGCACPLFAAWSGVCASPLVVPGPLTVLLMRPCMFLCALGG